MKVQLILERTSSYQITDVDWVKYVEHKIVEAEIPNTDNSNQSKKGKWEIVGYCEVKE